MIETEEKAALKFLEKYGVTFSAVQAVPQTPPLWAKRGDKYGIKWSITLHKGDANGKEIEFPFWSSIRYRETMEKDSRFQFGKLKHPKPSAYDVLAGIQTDTSGGFEDFCSSYGFDTDSRQAERMFNACVDLNAKLAQIFTAEALEELNEIQ